MKPLGFLLVIILAFGCQSEPSSNKQERASTVSNVEQPVFQVMPYRNPPAEVSYKGTIRKGLRWQDRNGENILYISTKDTKEESRFWVVQITKKDNKWVQSYELEEQLSDCDFVWTLEPIEEALTVSDLDKDGFGEFTFLFKKDCAEEVSPTPMFLYLVENQEVFISEGNTKVETEIGEQTGGDFTLNEKLNSGSPEIARYVEIIWKRFAR